MKGKLPDRWTDYSKMGNVVPGTRFLPVKVPLKSYLTRYLPRKQWFSPNDLLNLAKEKGFNVGMVIDLSFTSRYYCSDDFTQHGIKYVKIFMPGRQIPDKDIMTQFYDAVLQFEKENSHNNHSIVVHCTHGLNRTGYMVCKFMTEKMNMSADSAIAKFNRARGHDIERDIYLNDLKSLLPEGPNLKVEEFNESDIRSQSRYTNTHHQNNVRATPSSTYGNFKKEPPTSFYQSYTNPNSRSDTAFYQHSYPVAPKGYYDSYYEEPHYMKPYGHERKSYTSRNRSHPYFHGSYSKDNRKTGFGHHR